MAIVAKWPGDLLECPLRQVDRSPFRAADAHGLAIVIQRHRAKKIRLVLVPPDIGRVFERDRGHDAIHEDEERQVVGAEERLPVRQPVDIFLSRPALPHIARPVSRPAGEAPALHIDEQLRPRRPQHDEVEILDGHIAEHRAASFIDGDIAQPLLREERLERRFVGIAAVHGAFLNQPGAQATGNKACPVACAPGW